MARVTHAAPYLPIVEVKNLMRTDLHAMSRHGFLLIYNAPLRAKARLGDCAAP
jgi:hypothetical protein